MKLLKAFTAPHIYKVTLKGKILIQIFITETKEFPLHTHTKGLLPKFFDQKPKKKIESAENRETEEKWRLRTPKK